MILRGRIVADCVVAAGREHRPPGRHLHAVDRRPVAGRITQIWGNNEVDTFQFGDPCGHRRRHVAGDGISTFASDGYIFIGSKTRVCGSNSRGCDTAGDAAHDPSLADGEDAFHVCYLQSPTSSRAPAHLGHVDAQRRPLADARRPGRHRLLRASTRPAARASSATTSSTCSTRAPRTTASTS